MRSDGRERDGASFTRRRLLAAGAVAVAGGAAGCSEGGSTDGTPSGASTTDPGDGSDEVAAPDVGGGTATPGPGDGETSTPVPGPQVALQFDPGPDRRSVRIFHGSGAAITPDNTAAIVLSTEGSVSYPTDAIAADGTVEGDVTVGEEIAAVEGIPDTGTVFVFWKGPDGKDKLLGRWEQEG